MYVKIHSNKSYIGGNTQSCGELVKYLSKENEGKELVEYENFFNSQGKDFTDFQVICSIDQNVKGLHKKEAKFFMVTINPSQNELQHLAFMTTGSKVEELSQMTFEERERYNQIFKEYVNDCMELYAQGFKKDLGRNDILYFAKIEQFREYKLNDKPVKEHQVKEGEQKPGLQTHCHIIVSRKDRSMTKSISPLANSRGKSSHHQLNGKLVQVGFDRYRFKLECEVLYDLKYEYSRNKEEHILTYKLNKHNIHVSPVQYQNYVNDFKNLANFHEQSQNMEVEHLIHLAKGVKKRDLNQIWNSTSEGIKNVGDLRQEEFNHIPTQQLVNLVKNIIAGNPVKISKELVKSSQGLEM